MKKEAYGLPFLLVKTDRTAVVTMATTSHSSLLHLTLLALAHLAKNIKKEAFGLPFFILSVFHHSTYVYAFGRQNSQHEVFIYRKGYFQAMALIQR